MVRNVIQVLKRVAVVVTLPPPDRVSVMVPEVDVEEEGDTRGSHATPLDWVWV